MIRKKITWEKQEKEGNMGKKEKRGAKHGLGTNLGVVGISLRANDSGVEIQPEKIETFISFKLHRLIRFK